MTHKQLKPSPGQDRNYKSKTISNVEHHSDDRPRRSLLLSCEDVERMAVESSRARLMMQLVSEPNETSREFGSYFSNCRGLKDESDPFHTMTSHTSTIPIPKRIIPTYPSMVQAIRWCPKIERSKSTYSADSMTDSGDDDANFKCRCRKCKMRHCRGKVNSNSKPKCFKDNIVIFTDNSTMTPHVQDTGCGSHSPIAPTSATSDVSIGTSESIPIEHDFSQTYRAAPIPILKKPQVNRTMRESVRDTKIMIPKKPTKIFKKRSEGLICPNNSDESSGFEYGRKVIYNEGISDSLKSGQSRRSTPTRSPARTPSRTPTRTPTRVQSPVRVKRNESKSSVGSKVADKEATIPFAHRERSRYHSDCRHSISKTYRCEIDDHLQGTKSPKDFRKTVTSDASRRSPSPPIQLPKRVLTSERDIEAFVDKRKTNNVRRRLLF
ncbi:unnamed protein product [Danaus chrysippus]|uniref:(African queen) hypothetical protein n=1 Tax=Danaus chrysippus TaxID=151541 RepID=A0A8J2R030_9NEOP|nr:unnamed protein product [Danaus chrysippus]